MYIYNHVRTYTYDDNWNIMCVDKQNNVCLNYILILVIVMCDKPI
jgi:hypothetical protein